MRCHFTPYPTLALVPIKSMTVLLFHQRGPPLLPLARSTQSTVVPAYHSVLHPCQPGSLLTTDPHADSPLSFCRAISPPGPHVRFIVHSDSVPSALSLVILALALALHSLLFAAGAGAVLFEVACILHLDSSSTTSRKRMHHHLLLKEHLSWTT